MKKTVLKAIVLALSLSLLTGCVLYNGKNKDGSPKGGSSSQPSSSEPATSDTTSSSSEDPEVPPDVPPTPPTPAEGQLNVYLVLGPNGRYENTVGEDIPSKFLENTKLITLAYGADLPGKSVITSTVSGSTFSHWINRETTETATKTPYEKVESGEVVYVAVFSGGSGGNTPVTPDDGLPTSGYGFIFDDHTKENPHYKVGEDAGQDTFDGITYDQKHIRDFTLVQDQKFQLYDFGSKAGWTVNLDPASCNHNVAKYIEIIGTVGQSSSWYHVKETFDAKDIYIKLAFEHDQLYIGKEADQSQGDLPTEGYGFYFLTEEGVEPYYKVGEYKGKETISGVEYDQYQIADFRLIAGQKFRLINYATRVDWSVPLDPYSCGANGDASKVADYIAIDNGFYHVMQTFDTNGIYIKLAFGQDQLYIGLAGGSSTPDPTPDPAGIPTSGYGLWFQVGSGEDPKYFAGSDEGEREINGVTYHQYLVQNVQFAANDRFQLYDFANSAGWTVAIDPYSCGASGNAEALASYLTIDGNWYVVQQAFAAGDIYIKLAYGNDQIYIGL